MKCLLDFSWRKNNTFFETNKKIFFFASNHKNRVPFMRATKVHFRTVFFARLPHHIAPNAPLILAQRRRLTPARLTAIAPPRSSIEDKLPAANWQFYLFCYVLYALPQLTARKQLSRRRNYTANYTPMPQLHYLR